MNSPRRRETRKTYLDASVAPVEAALAARSGVLDRDAAVIEAGGPGDPEAPIALTKRMIAAEYRNLAEELHWW